MQSFAENVVENGKKQFSAETGLYGEEKGKKS